MQIKTVVGRIDNAENFDTQVNKYLRDGWRLKRRYLSTPRQGGTLNYYRMLIAELVKDDTKAISEVREARALIDYDHLERSIRAAVYQALKSVELDKIRTERMRYEDYNRTD